MKTQNNLENIQNFADLLYIYIKTILTMSKKLEFISDTEAIYNNLYIKYKGDKPITQEEFKQYIINNIKI